MTHAIPLALALFAAAPGDEAQDWPRSFPTPNGVASVYTPQLEDLQGDHLTARAAVSVEPKGGDAVFGVAFFTAAIDVDRDEHRVTVRSLEVTKLRFPGLTPDLEAQHAATLGAEMTKWDLSFPLETMLASLEVADRERTTPGLKTDAPKILVATEPTVLVTIDGEPKMTPIEGTSLSRVINTQFLLVQDAADSHIFLTSGASWFAAPEVKGPWEAVLAPSRAVLEWFSKQPPPPPPDEAPPETPPHIVVVTAPTELLQFSGKPRWTPITGVGLLTASNTDSDLFLEVASQKLFLCLAGRWYSARKVEGPWTFVPPNKLPKDFAKIPPESDSGHVLAFVAGTPQAADALADTQVPTTSTVRRDAGRELLVYWDGEPQFKAIEGTSLAYGVNTTFSVLLADAKYWVCHQAVWYVGATPKGPWTVSDVRPPGIDTVPPSAPVYNVKYVYVYDVRPDVVVVGYLPGYVGVYPFMGVPVYGTGFVYPAHVTVVVWAPRPVTWGVRVGFNPWMGWGVRVGFGTPFMRVGIGFGGFGAFGPMGFRPVPPPRHRPVPTQPRPPGAGGVPPGSRPPPGGAPPPPGTPGGGGTRPDLPGGGQGGDRTRPNVPGGGPGAGGIATPTPPAADKGGPGGGYPGQQPPSSNIYQRPDNANRNAARPATPQPTPYSGGGRPNDVYAGKNGEVYRNGSRGWEQRQGNQWQQSGNRGYSAPPSNVYRDSSARQRTAPSGGAPRGGSGGGGRRR